MRQVSVGELTQRVAQGVWHVQKITMSSDLALKGRWPVTSLLDPDPAMFKNRILDIGVNLQSGVPVTVTVSEVGTKEPDFTCEVTK